MHEVMTLVVILYKTSWDNNLFWNSCFIF